MKIVCRLVVAIALISVWLIGLPSANATTLACWSNTNCADTTWAINQTAPGTSHHTWQDLGITNFTPYTVRAAVWNNSDSSGNVCASTTNWFAYSGTTTYFSCSNPLLGFAHGAQYTRTTIALHGHGHY